MASVPDDQPPASRRSPSRSPSAKESEREPLAGLVERVVFHSEDSGFAVLRVKVRDRREPVTVVGHAPSVAAGEHVQASGAWETDRRHGPQFRARYLRISPPSSLQGMERYLASGLIKGVGPATARRLVAAFGERVFDVIERSPERLREVEGIGPLRAQRITEHWEEQQAVREIMVFLQSHGVSTARALRIFKTYGADAVPLVAENPYRLAREIRGIGFRTADQIAAKLGVSPDSPLRAQAGLSWVLSEAAAQGHCGLPRNELLRTAAELLEMPGHVLETALSREIRDGSLRQDTLDSEAGVFLPSLWEAERRLAASVLALASDRPAWLPLDAERAISWVERSFGIDLATSQRRALHKILGSKVSILTGGPGVGKTTLVRALLRILQARGVEAALCAPTGRAAKRLSESTGIEAKTIHRLLESGPTGFRRGPDSPLDCDLLVVDETSMVDVPLCAALLGALPAQAAVLLIGDADQLPSVGPGQVLADLIESGAFPVAGLIEVFRQAAESTIILNAHRVNRGEMPLLEPVVDQTPRDFFFVDSSSAEDALDKLVRMVRERIPRRFGLDPVRDIQVLTPMNRGPLGAHALNLALQSALNPDAGGATVERFGWAYRAGDKVMQTENDYDKDVFNGDLGLVAGIDRDAQEVVLSFEGREVVYEFGELDRVSLAYATTIHKSQGSEYPAVVLTLTTQHYPMLRRNLLYTGITRGQRLVVLLGQRRALSIAVQGRGKEHRWTKLRDWLTAGAPPFRSESP